MSTVHESVCVCRVRGDAPPNERYAIGLPAQDARLAVHYLAIERYKRWNGRYDMTVSLLSFF
jgi:hypothetical protein